MTVQIGLRQQVWIFCRDNEVVLAEIELCRLYEAMNKLTKRQMEVIRLYFYKGMSQQAIAQKLGIGRRAVGNCIEGALKKIKKNFQKSTSQAA